MKIQSAYFKFKGWRFEWEPIELKPVLGRKTKVMEWLITVHHTKGKTTTKINWHIQAAAPTAKLCRRIKKLILWSQQEEQAK